MLRSHVVQVSHNLSDPAMEDLLYEAGSVRRFVGLRQRDPIPDESTLLHFRHLLERHDLGQGLFQEINEHLAAPGFRGREGARSRSGPEHAAVGRAAGTGQRADRSAPTGAMIQLAP